MNRKFRLLQKARVTLSLTLPMSQYHAAADGLVRCKKLIIRFVRYTRIIFEERYFNGYFIS